MRRRLAAAALAAALGAAAASGCSPSDLTPGWIGEQGLEGGAASGIQSGVWSGPTSNGGTLRFVAVDGNVSEVRLEGDGPCRFVFFSQDTIFTQNQAFGVTYEIDSGGFFSIQGTFTSATTCGGTYSYTGTAPVAGCPRDAAGSFTAVPVR